MILADTRKAAKLFAAFNVPIAGYLVNRVIPEDLVGENVPAYLKNRIEMQRKYLTRIRGDFGEEILAEVPEMERDVTGMEMIERMATLMYGEA
jgi:arsenite/tail-anchored protein-transporting ATPase